MIEVQIDGIPDTLEFPEGTDDSVIQSVVDRMVQSRAASAGNAFMAGGGVGTGQAMSGLARLGDLIARSGLMIGPGGALPVTEPAMVSQRVEQANDTPAQREQRIQQDPLYQAGQALAQGARDAFPTNPRYQGEMLTDVLPGSLGQMLPTVAASMANPVLGVTQYGMSAGQGGAEDAIASGRPDQAQNAFALNAPVGALSEALLGSAGGIRLLRDLAKARGLLPAIGRGAFREGTQETVEQLAGNAVAAGLYDPKRNLGQGVLQAAAAGALLGGAFGGVAGLSTRGPAVSELGPSTDAPAGPVISDPDLNELPPPPAEVVPTLAPALAAAPAEPMPAVVPNETPPAELAATPAPQQPGPSPDQAGQDVPVSEAAVPAVEGAVPAVDGMAPNSVAATSTDPDQAAPASLDSTVATPDGLGTVPSATALGAETITGSNERTGSEMPAEREERLKPRRRRHARADEQRPPDIIDAIEGEVGKVNLALLLEADPSFKPSGDARRILVRKGGIPADVAAEMLSRTGQFRGQLETADALLSAIRDASQVRKAWRKQFHQDERELEVQSRQITQFQAKAIQGERAKSKRANVQQIAAESLVRGDEFEVDGHRFEVVDLELDEDSGDLVSVTIKDGPKFGVQRVDGQEVLHIDKATLRNDRPVEFAPDDPFAGEADSGPSTGERIIAKLDALDNAIRSNTYSDPLMLTTMARAAISIARTLVRGGMAIDRAIRQAVAAARQQFPAAPDNDDDLIDAMARGLNTRQFVDQMDEDPRIGTDVRTRVTNVLYVRQPNEDSAAFAGRVLDQVGPEQGMLVFRDSGNGLDGASRTMLGQLITRRLATAETQARQAGRLQEADAIAQQAAAFVNEDLLPYSTDIAQALQAFSAFRFLTPAATIDWARRQIERAARRVRQESGVGTDAVADRMQAVTGETLEPVTTTPEVQGAAGQAVDDAVEAQANSPSGPVADAMRMEASNNIEMLPSMREARTAARVRALQQVARASGYWQTIVNTSSRQLERRLEGLLRGSTGPRANGETVASLASTLTEVLGQQLDAVLGRGITPATRTRPDHLLRLRQLLSNSERMSQIWRQVREAIAADERFANDPRIGAVLNSEFDVWSAPLLRRVIDQSLEAQDISIRELVRRNYQLRQGALGERLATELGLAPELAQRLATAADAAYLEAMNQVRQSIPQRVQRIRRTPTLIRALRTGLIEGLPTAEVDRALADAISRTRVNLGRLVRRHYREVDAQGRTLAQVLVQEAGVSGPVADQLAAAVRAQFAAAADQRRQQELQRIIASGTPPTRQVRQAWERIVEMANLGAVNTEAAWNAIQDRLDLPRWTPELAADVRRLADAIQTAAEGIPQQRAVQALIDRLARANMRWWDLPIAFWYANVLSGPVTQARNVLGNVTQVMANTLVSLRRPQDWPAQMAALGRGLAMGGRDSIDFLRTGRVTGPRSNRAEAAKALELVSLPGRLDYMLTPWRLVGRTLAATDTLFFRGASEQRAELLSRMLARSEGLRGQALNTRVAEILGRSDVSRADARRVALAEGLTGMDLTRRIDDITERARPQAIRENARQYGLRATFNQEPYGVLGAAARGINRFSNEVPAFRFIVPFTNVVANVVNEGLSWFPPTAIGRSLWGHFRGELEGRPIASDEDLYDQHARAALGLVLLSGVFAAAAAYQDDEDPWFAVTSLGPHDSGRRAQLRQRGWIPHSVKVGDRYVSYANTPLAIPMAWLGNWFDGVRFNRLNELDLYTRLAYALSNTGQVILDQSFLDGLSRFLGGLQKDDPKASARMLEGFARSATSMVVPNALRQIDRMFDPTIYDSPTMEAALVNSIPFARRAGQPALNVWGQPVQIGTADTFVSQAKEDPVLAALARHNLWISTPSSKTMVDQKPLTPDEVHVYTAARGPRLHELLSMPGVLALLETGDAKVAERMRDRAQDAAAVSGAVAVRRYRAGRN